MFDGLVIETSFGLADVAAATDFTIVSGVDVFVAGSLVASLEDNLAMSGSQTLHLIFSEVVLLVGLHSHDKGAEKDQEFHENDLKMTKLFIRSVGMLL